MSCFAASYLKLLHDCLCHPSLAKLKIMVPSLKQLQMLDCESCQLRKYVRSFFRRPIEKRCNSVFYTIHSNIWGPSQITSFGFRYFVTFIDEYSRCTWVDPKRDINFCPSSSPSLMWLRTNLAKQLKLLEVTIPKNLFQLNFLLFYPHRIFCINPCVHTHHKKL